jgi:hypothetical protein
VAALFVAMTPHLARAVDFKIDIPPSPPFDQRDGANDEPRETSDELQSVIDAATREIGESGAAGIDVPLVETGPSDFEATESAQTDAPTDASTQSQADAQTDAQADTLDDGARSSAPMRGTRSADAWKSRRPSAEGDSRAEKARKRALVSGASRDANTVTAANGFPAMQCLTNNVRFWERVYSEVDEHQMLVHDREDLSIVYAVVNVPPPHQKQARQTAMRLWRAHFEKSLGSLATKAHAPSRWTPEERKLAKRLPGEKLNAAWLRGASSNIRFQGGMKTRFEGGITRSLKYMPAIHPIIQSHGLPADIVHLPHVESSYVSYARSKVGAVGLWQIMPDTMRMLLGRSYVHRRTEVNVATRAAAKLLRQNYATTKSWPLALTAYNHGLAGVMRAVRRTGSNDLCEIIERYEHPTFRFASSNFYAQFLAARNLALQRYETLANERGTNRILKEVLASHAKEGST